MAFRVSVITQAYNNEAELKRCIESVLKQTYSDFEFILIDNGSADQTGAIMDRYAAEDQRIRVLHNAQNMGYEYWILHIKDLIWGDGVVSLDADDWIEADYLEKCVHEMLLENADMVCAQTTYHYSDGSQEQIEAFSTRQVIERNDFCQHMRLFTCIEHIWAKLIRTSVIMSANLSYVQKNVKTDSGIGYDGNLWWACLAQSNRIVCLPEYIHHRLVEKDISAKGYYSRLPKLYYSLPIILQQEYELLDQLGCTEQEPYDVALEEFMVKLGECFEYDLLGNGCPRAERVQRIAKLLTLDNEIPYITMLEERGQWDNLQDALKQFKQDGTNVDDGENKKLWRILHALQTALMMLQFQMDYHNKICTGLNATVRALEKDRSGKDEVIAEREKTIETLIHDRNEKDATIAEREKTIRQLIAVRDAKDAIIAQREQTILELIQVGEQKDHELAQKDAIIEALRQGDKV